MKTCLFRFTLLLVLLASLFPVTVAFADDDDGNYEFYGTIESLPNTPGWIGDWVVSGRTVHVSDATRIEQEHGAVAIGAYIEVKGWLQGDGSVDATKIEVKSSTGGGGYVEFYGTIESLPEVPGWIGDWMVSGRTVHVSDATRIEQEHGVVSVGAYVEVKGDQRTDGSISATKIEVKMAPDTEMGTYIKFYGTIESLPATGLIGDWTVSGRTVHVDAATRTEQEHGPVTVGAYVEVKGWLQADDSVNATKIEVKEIAGGGDGGGSYVKFYGTVEGLPAEGLIGDWTVSGRTVHVDATTRIEQEHGPVSLGAYVEVKGWLQADDSVNATKIEVKEKPGEGSESTKFKGTIEQLPDGSLIGNWVVSGRTVIVSDGTRIDQEHGSVAVGAYVEVEGWLQADGSINATKIEVKSGADHGTAGYVKFYGVIEDLPASGLVGDWLVSGRTVHVSAATRIEQEHGSVRIGASVEVKGVQQADGSVNANKIEVKS